MHLLDINVWIALAFPTHTHHAAARAWFDAATTPASCHFCRITQLGFLRIANNPAALATAVTQDQAWQLYDHFLAHPRVAFADEPVGIESFWRPWAQQPRFSGKVWADAYLAAFAAAGGFEVVTFDRGFAQYANLKATILS